MALWSKDPSKPKTTIIHAVDKESGMQQRIRFHGTEAELAQEVNTIKSCGMRIVEMN